MALGTHPAIFSSAASPNVASWHFVRYQVCRQVLRAGAARVNRKSSSAASCASRPSCFSSSQNAVGNRGRAHVREVRPAPRWRPACRSRRWSGGWRRGNCRAAAAIGDAVSRGDRLDALHALNDLRGAAVSKNVAGRCARGEDPGVERRGHQHADRPATRGAGTLPSGGVIEKHIAPGELNSGSRRRPRSARGCSSRDADADALITPARAGSTSARMRLHSLRVAQPEQVAPSARLTSWIGAMSSACVPSRSSYRSSKRIAASKV